MVLGWSGSVRVHREGREEGPVSWTRPGVPRVPVEETSGAYGAPGIMSPRDEGSLRSGDIHVQGALSTGTYRRCPRVQILRS